MTVLVCPVSARRVRRSLRSRGATLCKRGNRAADANLRPVQSKADCAAALSLMAVICGAAVTEGSLQLIWDESDKSANGYKVYELGAGGHKLLGTSTARYYSVKRPSEGDANLCFAVEASVGSRTSADSSHYCYAPGATAVTRSFKPINRATRIRKSPGRRRRASRATGSRSTRPSPAPSFSREPTRITDPRSRRSFRG